MEACFELRIPWASAELNAVMPTLVAEARVQQTAHAVVCGLSVHVADIGHAMHVRIECEEWETGYFLRGDSLPVFVQAPFNEFEGQSGRVRIERSGLLYFRYGLKNSGIGGN